MWKTGHSLIKSKMKETGAPLAGEMSGHIFFAHDYYGFDDALYAAVRLIRAVTQLGGSLTALAHRRCRRWSTRPRCASRSTRAASSRWSTRCSTGSPRRAPTVDRTDGARVNTADGWWLLRASNTQDVLVARAEAKDQAGLDRLRRPDRRAARAVRRRARAAGGALMPKLPSPRAVALLPRLGGARDRRDGARRDVGRGGAGLRPAARADAALGGRSSPATRISRSNGRCAGACSSSPAWRWRSGSTARTVRRRRPGPCPRPETLGPGLRRECLPESPTSLPERRGSSPRGRPR